MTQTIESFVQKIQAEGVQAGKDAADKLLADAQAQAQRICSDAQAQAQRILADAQAQADRLADRQRQELNMGARDTVLRLREGVNQALTTLMRHEVGQAMADTGFLQRLIEEVVCQYAQADAHGNGRVQVSVNKDALQTLTDWAIHGTAGAKGNGKVDLKGTLKAVGFEYSVGESTVEVTVDSIVAVLKEHMTPRLREVLDQALAGATA